MKKLGMLEHMITWFSATVSDEDGDTIFEASSKTDLLVWANQHKEHASCTCYIAYMMDDDGEVHEDVGPLADYIDWPEPECQRPPVTVPYALLIAGMMIVLDKFRINGRLRPWEPEPF